jgi:hypothetical protein
MSSDNTVFIIVLLVILLVTLYYLFSSTPIHNDGKLQMKNNSRSSDMNDQDSDSNDSNDSDNSDNSDNSSDIAPERCHDDDSVSLADLEMDDSVDSSIEIIKERSMGMNGPYFRRKNGGKYIHDSYRSVGTGNNLKQVDKQFQIQDVMKNYTDRFLPVDESDGQFAPVNFKNTRGTEKDKYNINTFLPQEKEKDWFETIETVDVKNSNLINIYRPIGADTIGSTHKEAIYDIRGLDKAFCPKYVVSPWLQSSTEPDRSTKSLC